MTSQEALQVFVSKHGHERLGVDSYGNCHFQANIDYESTDKNIRLETEVTIIRNGFDDGTIRFSENNDKEFTSDYFHMDFKAKFLSITYSSKYKTLKITGNSPKMGNYNVTIIV